jgi:hypothetical protein
MGYKIDCRTAFFLHFSEGNNCIKKCIYILLSWDFAVTDMKLLLSMYKRPGGKQLKSEYDKGISLYPLFFIILLLAGNLFITTASAESG